MGAGAGHLGKSGPLELPRPPAAAQMGCPRKMPELPASVACGCVPGGLGACLPRPELSCQVLVALRSLRLLRGARNGLSCVPKTPVLKPQPPAPQNVAVFGDQDFNEVTEVHGVTSVGLIPSDRSPHERR